MIKIENGKIYCDNDSDGLNYCEVNQYQIGDILTDFFDQDHQPTLREVLQAIRNYHVLMTVFPRFFMLEDNINDEATVPDEEVITRLEVIKHVSYVESSTSVSMNIEEMNKRGPNEDGLYPVVFDTIDKPYRTADAYCGLSGFSDDTDDIYSVSLTPLSQILDVPIRFGGSKISIEIEETCNTYIVDDEPSIGVFEGISAIIEDLTFHGSDNDKSSIISELTETMEEIKKISSGRKNDPDDGDCDATI